MFIAVFLGNINSFSFRIILYWNSKLQANSAHFTCILSLDFMINRSRNNKTNKSCYICEKEIVDKIFYLGHDHMTGNIHGFNHTEYNKNFKIS